MQIKQVGAGFGALTRAGQALPVAAEVPFKGDSETALNWATEVLRVRRFPKITGIYSGNVRPEVVASGGAPAGDEGYALALSIYQCVHELDNAQQELLQLHVWGDYADPVRLRAAEAMQEKCRQQGKRVRLSYRYSQRQLAAILGIGKSTVQRRLEKAFAALAAAMLLRGLTDDA